MLLGIDQGTTGTTAVVFDTDLEVVADGYAEVPRETPRAGWVEIDPEHLLASVEGAVARALDGDAVAPGEIEVVGLANQGETCMCWDGDGTPLYNAIVWQDRRTSDRCDRLADDDEMRSYIRETTGLRVDPYFSATKLEWLVDEVDAGDDLYCGTTDTWLLWNLVEGSPYVTDVATASRTMLFDLHRLDWDERLVETFGLTEIPLPEPVPMDHVVGHTDPSVLGGVDAPVTGCIVDQQAALYGQGCTAPGDAKCTYGTGSFLLMHTGDEPSVDTDGVLGTVAWTVDGETSYALDGGIYTTGAFVDWLVDKAGLADSPAATEELARSVESTDTLVVPALQGLAAPYWDSSARAAVLGIDASTTNAHIVRAALEGITYRVRDVVDTMVEGTGIALNELRVDGGLTRNDFILQQQADVLDTPLSVSAVREATALGTAALAARSVGLDVDRDRLGASERTVRPEADREETTRRYRRWKGAVDLCRQFE